MAAHGTRTAYVRGGCRCEPCREANNAYQRQWATAKRRAQGVQPKRRAPHGSATRYQHGPCRCEPCTAANRARMRALKGQPAPNHGRSGYVNYACRCPICREAGSIVNRVYRERRKLQMASA